MQDEQNSHMGSKLQSLNFNQVYIHDNSSALRPQCGKPGLREEAAEVVLQTRAHDATLSGGKLAVVVESIVVVSSIDCVQFSVCQPPKLRFAAAQNAGRCNVSVIVIN